MKTFYTCRCFYTNNIFIKSLNCHVKYEGKAKFLLQYQQFLREKAVVQEEDINSVIDEIEYEVQRRKNLGKNCVTRQQIIEEKYTKLHPQLFTLKESFLAQDFLNLVKYTQQEDASFEEVFDFLQQTEIQRCYSVKVFTEEFCRQFLEEVQHFENSDCPKGRPNTMNSYGVLLEELGFDTFFTDLREKYLQPVCRLLYPDWGGYNLDSHKAFIVQYNQNGDTDLSYHYDNAEVTLNVALSPDDAYDKGDLFFGSMRTERFPSTERHTYKHRFAMGLLHRGQHMHGASPISRGDRYNLIIWMRASAVRNKKCPMCDSVPDLVETVGFGDGFTKDEQPVVNVCSLS